MSTLSKNMTTDPAYHRPPRRQSEKKPRVTLSQSVARALTVRPDWFVEENVARLLISGSVGQSVINGARRGQF